MARRYGYAHTIIYNNEAYELDGIEFAEFEDICTDLKIEEGEPFYYKALYEFLQALGYDVEPPDPKFCPTKEELEKLVPSSTVSGEARDKWTKDKILKEKEKLLRKEKKLLEMEDKLRKQIETERKKRKGGASDNPSKVPTGRRRRSNYDYDLYTSDGKFNWADFLESALNDRGAGVRSARLASALATGAFFIPIVICARCG